MIRLVWSIRHAIHALFDDAEALPHLLHAHHCPVVAVAMGGGRNIELELLVTGIRLLLAEVPFEAASPKSWVR